MTTEKIKFNDAVNGLLQDPEKHISILTGAGISAESGIPTFRGPEGYWTVGSEVYMPEQMATRQMFDINPEEVWHWYLYRLGVCHHAQPNPGHYALVEMENKLADRFTLITQNVDNLHIRSGNSHDRTFQIHGNITFTRCSQGCTSERYLLAEDLLTSHAKENTPLTDKEITLLHCPNCQEWLRPHVLWFDEYYDEENYHVDTVMNWARQTDLLIIIGTSGATNLPNQIASTVQNQRHCIIDINIEENLFSAIAKQSPGGQFIKANSANILPQLADLC
jgi:NAD-dependent deacetylase